MNAYNWNNIFPDMPKSFKSKVNATLSSLPEKEENEMKNLKPYKRGSMRKKIIIILAATMVIGTTVFAAGKAGKIQSIYGSSSAIPTYTTIPTVEQVKNKFKFNPKLVDKFDNGYTFADGYTDNKKGVDENGNSVKKTKSLDFTYTKGNDKLYLSMENEMLEERSNKETVVNTCNGIDLYYSSSVYKTVPANYKLTEQDKQDKLSGKYVFSYGSEKIEISQFKYLDWMQDGIHYSLSSMNSNISKDELVKMAPQVIRTK
ncbi:signal peptide protein [Clostridium estertheticum]|uniref:hypothetical protein n=1 Tax=Clostridium estertheticum TaxID=238834 RepID=UPI001C0DAE06|nr:hypothetical protein [Clostridium estertheticum]MBU3199870.1 signal peptide protein [Clostridium estertheticum]WAG67030.1 signal peptide protein [Clostridium estertheticum]